MDLWGDDVKPAVSKLKVKKPEKSESKPEVKFTELQEVYTAGVAEGSSPEQWAIWSRKIEDDIKNISIRQSEIKELRGFVSSNERRLSALIQELKEYKLSVDKRIDELENYSRQASGILEQINKALGED